MKCVSPSLPGLFLNFKNLKSENKNLLYSKFEKMIDPISIRLLIQMRLNGAIALYMSCFIARRL